MMFSRYLESASKIMAAIGGQKNLANHMHNFAQSIREAITKYGIIQDPVYGQVYAFEVDGYGSGALLLELVTSHADRLLYSKPHGRC
jgi:meiotically up-regulated gene 157 (Mug157) protein